MTLHLTQETFNAVVSHYQDAIPEHLRKQVKLIALALELGSDFRDCNLVMKKIDFEDLCTSLGYITAYDFIDINNADEDNLITIQKSIH